MSTKAWEQELWRLVIAAWNTNNVENVVMHKHYSLNWTAERGNEHIAYGETLIS